MAFFDWLKRLFGLSPDPRKSVDISPHVIGERGTTTAAGISSVTPSSGASLPPSTTQPLKKQQRPRSLKLDIGQFAPASDAETKQQARGLGSRWGNPWFGRRDLIPPASDQRTLIIDRAMVGHGIISPEQLTEIHEIGEQMDRVRPDLALAQQIADQAVTRDREDREAIKQRKKAEAAERKRLHAEAVEKRKKTDIVFLGRGVSRGLADRRANIEKLTARGLPLLATPVDVAQALGVSIPRLRWLAFHSEASKLTHYVRFSVPKKSGGTRQLAAPRRDLAACQSWILVNVLGKIAVHDAAHGFVARRNTVSNAAPHVARSAIINADITDFFPTISFARVKGVFQELGYSPAVATIFGLLCTESPRRVVTFGGQTLHVATGQRALPQGACTSPAISNLVARRLDARLTGIAKKLGWHYTRYADDLTFSAEGEATQRMAYLMARLRHIVADEGFRVNESKTRVLRRNTAQTVTGVVVNSRPGVRRRLVRRIRAILHRAKTEGLAAQNRQNHPHFELWLSGMIAYISMVNPNQGRPLRAALDALPR
jgi:retron-type reverse transcriptase